MPSWITFSGVHVHDWETWWPGRNCYDRNVHLLTLSFEHFFNLFRYIHMYTNYLNKNITCTMCLFKSALTRNKGKFGEDLSTVFVVYFILQDLGRRCSRHFLWCYWLSPVACLVNIRYFSDVDITWDCFLE